VHDDSNQRLFDELRQIRQDIHALREDFVKEGRKVEFESRVSELEIEERLRQISDELVEEQKPKKRGLFGRQKS
jgi:hypothetical protein